MAYTAVGASDAIGFGGSVQCLPFTACPTGTGYVALAARRLETMGSKVTLTNLGIPAAVIGPDFQALGVSYGRTIPGNFLQQEIPFIPKDTTLVSVFAGGNDINTVMAAIGGGAAGSDPIGYANRQITAFGGDYDALVRGVRERSPNARIVVMNLPNFAGLPFTASYPADRRQMIQKVSVGFSTKVVNAFVSQSIPVVDLLCDARAYQASNYSSDGFHPNDSGYAFIADELFRAITSSNYPTPRTSCPQMTLVTPLP